MPFSNEHFIMFIKLFITLNLRDCCPTDIKSKLRVFVLDIFQDVAIFYVILTVHWLRAMKEWKM